jgi:peptide deformylase
MRELIKNNNPILKAKCITVIEFNDSLHSIITDMRNIMLHNNGCGLAAPQVGELKRIIIIKRQIKKGILVIVNPDITYKSEYTNKSYEGCLSYPDLTKEIVRPNSIEIKGQDIQGNWFNMTLNNLEARICCHEIDHLEGLCQVSTGIKKKDLKKAN